jgi:tRNA-splicing ligase RtcB (3'-phosphate/5'-hydroxy nucleic acid ligase)
VGVHFGSRGFGHKTASGFLALAQGLAFDGRAHEGEMDSPPVLLVVGKVLEVLGAEPIHEVHMGDESVILEGVASEDATQSLFSTVHGAERVMSRTQAAGRARLRDQGIVLVGGGADEAPEVYKRLPDVLAAHAGSIRVTHRLRPLGVAMAGRDVHDPYKDERAVGPRPNTGGARGRVCGPSHSAPQAVM